MARPRTKIFGVGINNANYPTQTIRQPDGSPGRWCCPYYKKWTQMFERVYSERAHKIFPRLADNTMAEEWKYFMNFREWMISQDYDGTTQLDKDILIQGNREYGPTTCCLVPKYLNTIFLLANGPRSEYPLGVYLRTNKGHYTKPFVSQCTDHETSGRILLGYFRTPEEAHQAWKREKINQIHIALDCYREEKSYRVDVEQAVLLRVDQLKSAIENNTEITFL